MSAGILGLFDAFFRSEMGGDGVTGNDEPFPMLATITAGSRSTTVVVAATSVRCGVGLGEDDTGTVFVCAAGGGSRGACAGGAC